MCNHYRLNPQDLENWAEWSGYTLRREQETVLGDVWPEKQASVVRRDGEDPVLDAMQWGFVRRVPGKREGTTKKIVTTNVRDLSSPYWKSMLAEPARHCLVPFTSFAEPKMGQGRDEHWFSLPSRPIAMFAGLWRPTEQGHCFAFLTCQPNPLVAALHPKAMPVILQPEDYDHWLSCGYEHACSLAQPHPSQLMEVA